MRCRLHVKNTAKSIWNTYCSSRINRHIFSAQPKIQHLCIYPRNPSIWRLIFCNIIKYCSSFWMDHKSESICAIIDRFWSIYDVRSVDFSLYLENGAICSALHTQIFLFGFFSQREDIFTHFIGLISSSRHKGFAKRNKQRGIFAFFNQFLARLNQHRCPATLIYGTTFPGSTKTHSTSPAGWSYDFFKNFQQIFYSSFFIS